MVFSSLTFLFIFLPAALLLYYLAPRRLRNLVLLAASLLFYIWGSGELVLILLVSVVVDYWMGFVAERGHRNSNRKLIRIAVGASVASNLALLGWFKYSNFFVDQLNEVNDSVGFGPIGWSEVVLPVGISFFTFQSMSYTIDVARGRCEHLRNPLDFALYVALFPQLIAGPIVRFHEIAAEIRDRVHSLERFAAGATRFTHGLAKKVIIADTLAPLADVAFLADPASLSSGDALIGMVAYSLQIYFDFSGYSDMAIGLGMMFGFSFPENFNRPYAAVSVTDFWRRWHITLSNWFRDYVYIPLGGNRGSNRRTNINLMLVFVITGFWHGANWTFIVWGIYHGAWLLFERLVGTRALHASGRDAFLRRTLTLAIVMVGWVIFRSPSVPHAFHYTRALVSTDFALSPPIDDLLLSRVLVTLLVGALLSVVPTTRAMGPRLDASASRFIGGYRYAVMLVGFPASALLVAAGTFSPFLYFQF